MADVWCVVRAIRRGGNQCLCAVCGMNGIALHCSIVTALELNTNRAGFRADVRAVIELVNGDRQLHPGNGQQCQQRETPRLFEFCV